MSLMQEIRNYRVDRGAVAMWWLGQNGFIFKSHEGTVLSTDLYLTNSVAEIQKDSGLKLDRQAPVLIEPGEVDVDVYACTHSHLDHADPYTIRDLRHKDTMRFIGPAQVCDIYRAEGIESGRVTMAWPLCELEFHDISIKGAFALPTDDTDLNHMGYVFRFGNGPTIYMTGDTDYSELLASAAKHKPDVVITCINAGYNNLSHFEAAQMVSQVKPKIAIPCHYDMLPDNSVDPGQFRASLKLQAPDVQYQELRHGKRFVFGE